MAQNDLVPPVAAAATSQVKLCPYDEEELHIWFRLIKAQFAASGIRSQKLKYDNALASLPKQVLRDILNTVDVCFDSDQPYDHLKDVLLGHLERANGSLTLTCFAFPWKCKASSPALMGRFKQHLPQGVSLDTDLFLAMFLIRLPPSMRETVGAGNHKTAAAIVKATDPLRDTQGSHNPMVPAATTQ
jgi:hypothetical protein